MTQTAWNSPQSLVRDRALQQERRCGSCRCFWDTARHCQRQKTHTQNFSTWSTNTSCMSLKQMASSPLHDPVALDEQRHLLDAAQYCGGVRSRGQQPHQSSKRHHLDYEQRTTLYTGFLQAKQYLEAFSECKCLAGTQCIYLRITPVLFSSANV